jgi:tetratricopeptide (TPR) repeat protein
VAIEGPLKELGLHDVFQLLDLSRKTGMMRVTSHLRNNEGMVAFDRGAIVYAEIRSNPVRIGELLVRAGRITEAELEKARALQTQEREQFAMVPRRLGQILLSMGVLSERDLLKQVEFQVTEVAFELLSWQEGFFSFAEGPLSGVPADAMVKIRTETVLMEGARRIDEWSRIEGHIPHLGVVPTLAPAHEGAAGDMALLDLLPGEWEVLAQVDGDRDVRGIARALARSEFEVARVLFGLVSTGVVALTDPGHDRRARASGGGDAAALLAAAEGRLQGGDIAAAKEAALAAAALRPGEPKVHMLLARAHLKENRVNDAMEEAKRAVRLDPLSMDGHRIYGLTLVAGGRFADAGEQFSQWERLATDETPAADRDTVASAKAATHQLAQLLGGVRG